MREKRSFWQKIRRALAHEWDCNNYVNNGEHPCDLDWGHKGLHQAYLDDGVWVWSTDKYIMGWVAYNKK